jgi:hypothetical protein
MILLFILVVVNSVVYTFFRSKENTDSIEFRSKTEFPETDSIGTNRYFGQVENYLSDYFLFKYCYIGGINNIRHALFNASNNNSKVIYGKDNWLFYNACILDYKGMDEFCGLKPLSQSSIDTAISNLNLIRNWCRSHNVIFIPVICPNKQSVYPELLPAAYKQYGDDHYDQLLKADTSLMDLRKALLAQKKNAPYPLYFSTDTHWNFLGSFFGAVEISKELHKHFSFIPVFNLSDISVALNDTLIQRDLARIANINDKEKADLKATFNKPIQKKIGKLFILHDSYNEYLRPYENQLFDSIKAVHIFEFGGSPQEILEYKPDVFIYEIVERYTARLNFDYSKFKEDTIKK